MLGGIDGATTHLAEQVVAKAHLPLIDPASTDQTVNQANIPWMFSLAPGDPDIAKFLAARLKRDPLVSPAPITIRATWPPVAQNRRASAVSARHSARRSGTPRRPARCPLRRRPRTTTRNAAHPRSPPPPATKVLAGPAARARRFSSAPARPSRHPTSAGPRPLGPHWPNAFSSPLTIFPFLPTTRLHPRPGCSRRRSQ